MHPRGDSAPLIVLGTMNFGARTPDAEARRILRRAVERGVTHLDTANAYAEGASERLVGEALRAFPGLHVATKVGLGSMRGPPEGLSRARLNEAIPQCLTRLGVGSVPLLYLHQPDPKVSRDELLDGVEDALSRGWIDAWALSNHSAWASLALLHAADQRGLPRPVAGQMLYNMIIRDLEHEYLSFARAYGLTTVVFNPLAGGLLTGLHPQDAALPGTRLAKNPTYQRRYGSPRLRALVEGLRGVADAAKITLTACSYRWLVSQPGVDGVIVGPATVRHLDEALDALAEGPLPEELRRALDAAWRDWRGTDAVYAR
jgi:aryl-alcohol dehydrogenase-like predicted oxidoreductase